MREVRVKEPGRMVPMRAVRALASHPHLLLEGRRRVPVAQLDSSSGFLIRRSQVRILPGTPLLRGPFQTPGSPSQAVDIGRLYGELRENGGVFNTIVLS